MKKWPLILIICLLLASLTASGFLFYQNLKLHQEISQLTTQRSPSPVVTASPKASGKTDCPINRPRMCTFECTYPPPYLCGSDGKSYCTVCQACSNKNVSWYEMKTSPCEDEQFCGGFAGAICPEGYFCKYDGTYPDASGKCIKN